ncbi:unnamed protein product [Parnassius apollo]|uniref:(apollo) hypothetical protein n=1 Tax=Parnassius apollo TaxID=110799 RepID=A0A8S3XVF9_PARAO|nr:unnamed protein product [Parnassius apollo]
MLKVPYQSACFSRQINFYHFAIVLGNSKAKLDKYNIHSYYWDETSHCKDSNEIINAVYDFLKNLEFGDKNKNSTNSDDGSAGQNKHTGMNMIARLARLINGCAQKPQQISKN